MRPSLTTESDGDLRVRPSTLRFTTLSWKNKQTVTISASQDADSDPDTGAVTHAVTGADYEGTAAGGVTVTVDDDDVPSSAIRLTLASGQGTVREGGGTQEVEVTGELNGNPRDTDTVVTLTLERGTAQDEDFTPIEPVELTIIAGRTSRTVRVPVTPINDDIDEGAGETLQIATATTSGLPLGQNTAFTITIEDDDEAGITLSRREHRTSIRHRTSQRSPTPWQARTYGTASVQANDIAVTITDDDVASTGITISLSTDRVQESGGPIQITVTGELDASPVEDDTTVTLTLGRGTAQNNDFVGVDPVPLTIRGGQTRGSAQVTVTPIADYIDEGTGETLRLTATTIPGLQLRPQATFEITIEDDDGPASDAITLAVSTQTLRENAGRTQITVTAELNAGPANNDIIVTLKLQTGTAGIDDFVQIRPVNLTIERGRTNGSAQVPVTPVNDDIDEGADEILSLFADVSQPLGGLRIEGRNAFELTIEDDDEAGLVFSRNAVTMREGESATYTVRLNSEPTEPTTMTLSVTGTDAQEVTANPESIVFTPADWNTPRTVTVSTTKDGDGTPESAEIGHTLAGGGYDDIAGEVAITVEDVDTASRSVQIAIKPDRVEEHDAMTTVEITATLDGATRSVATSVELNANGGTATNGTDFTDIRSVATGADAALGHNGTLVQGGGRAPPKARARASRGCRSSTTGRRRSRSSCGSAQSPRG